MGRILGIDFGGKRCGIAVTDLLQIIVNPLKTVETKDLKTFLTKYIEEEEVDKIVFGLPTHADGSETYIVADIKKCQKWIREKYPLIEFGWQDESFTSREAARILHLSGIGKKKRQNKSLLDKVSAVLILQKYLGHI